MDSLPKAHLASTREKVWMLTAEQVGEWLLVHGYYPEPYVLPPNFKVTAFPRLEGRIKSHEKVQSRKNLAQLSYPKSNLVNRTFSLMHPIYYHDIVWEICDNWNKIREHLFNQENNIHCYSFPIPPNGEGDPSPLRSGRMIYEFLELAEKDLAAEAHNYNCLLKLDITNFYNSIYTHTLCWAWEGRKGKNGREECLKSNSSFGNRLDKLFQYSNDRRTVGIPIGPVLSDLVSEIILSERDLKISSDIKNDSSIDNDFVATRFRDDYKVLCKSEAQARAIAAKIISRLNEFNLVVNENKTKILELPEGLFREHSLKYWNYSLRRLSAKNLDGRIDFKAFEHTLLKTIEIHKEHPGTSLIEKFLSELIISKREKQGNVYVTVPIQTRLLLDFGTTDVQQRKNIKKATGLLLSLKNNSSKSFGKVLSILEWILLYGGKEWYQSFLKSKLEGELLRAIEKSSEFELVWLLYFNQRHNLNINLKNIYEKERTHRNLKQPFSQIEILRNPFVAAIRNAIPNSSKPYPNPFRETIESIEIMSVELTNISLTEYLDVFDRDQFD